MIDETVDWLRAEYESIFEDGSGAMKVHRGKVHKYLGMGLDFSHKGKCIVTMHDYLDGILKEFDAAMEKHEHGFLPVTRQHYETPAPDNLFIVNEDCEKLPDEMAADFHTIVAKTLYVTKRARPDTCLLIVCVCVCVCVCLTSSREGLPSDAIPIAGQIHPPPTPAMSYPAFLTTRVRAPDRDDWEKLHHLVEYLRKDHAGALVLGAKNDGLLMWYVDASFAVHPICGGIQVEV